MRCRETLAELASFLWERRAWWLAPIALVTALLGVLLAAGAGSVVGPLVYTLF